MKECQEHMWEWEGLVKSVYKSEWNGVYAGVYGVVGDIDQECLW